MAEAAFHGLAICSRKNAYGEVKVENRSRRLDGRGSNQNDSIFLKFRLSLRLALMMGLKLHCRTQVSQPITVVVAQHFDWLILRLRFRSPTTKFSLYSKLWSWVASSLSFRLCPFDFHVIETHSASDYNSDGNMTATLSIVLYSVVFDSWVLMIQEDYTRALRKFLLAQKKSGWPSSTENRFVNCLVRFNMTTDL